jgi:hypothetical protein
MTVLPLVSAWILGVLAVGALWPRAAVRRDLGLILPLGAGVGLGLTSALFYAASLTPWAGRVSALLECGLFCVLLLWAARRSRAADAAGHNPNATGDSMNRLDGAAVAERVACWMLLATAGVAGGAIMMRAWQHEPLGGWDAWAIWNMRARMMVRWDEMWPAYSAQPSLQWSHPDYPLLVSASVARGWVWLGAESAQYAALVSATFTTVSAWFLGAVLLRTAGFVAGAAGVALYMGTPAILTMASNQYADIPQGFFFLGTAGLIVLARREAPAAGLHVLTGLCLGLAAWTKNEGLLFVLVTALALAGEAAWRRTWRPLLPVALGLAAGLLPTLAFKLFHAPPNDLVAGASALGEKLFSTERHRLIAAAFWRDLRGFGGWQHSPEVLIAAGIFWGMIRQRNAGGTGWAVVATSLLLTWGGYYMVYVFSPRDLAWHLNTSLVRLYQQLWPSAVFLWCGWALAETKAAAGNLVQTEGTTKPGRALPWRFLAPAMLLAALATSHALSLQPGDQELARVRLAGGGTLTATAGDGWYGMELNAKHRWLWSQGMSTFVLHPEDTGNRRDGTFGFKFGVRSLDRRTLKIFLGDELIWEGVSEMRLRYFEVEGVPLSAAAAGLRFVSEPPGIFEADIPNARRLSFGIYDFALKP